MKERGEWSFEVAPGELVTIRLVPRGAPVSADNVGVWVDGTPTVRSSGVDATFSFAVSKPVSEGHVVELECNFLPDSPTDARYDLWIGGGGREFLRTVAQDDDHDVRLFFWVVAPSRTPLGRGEERERGGVPTSARPPQRGDPDRVSRSPPAAPARPSSGAKSNLVRGAAPPPRTPGVRPPRQRLVNLGFSAEARPAAPLSPATPLSAGAPYYFWLQFGPLVLDSLEVQRPVALPLERLPPAARLHVVLFTFPGELASTEGQEIGVFLLAPDGSTTVERQAALAPALAGSQIAGSPTLFFPVRAPQRVGVYRLRCSIYCKQWLVQSRLVSARVMKHPRRAKNALRSLVDYTLSKSVAPAHLARVGAHRLSLMLNDTDAGNVGLRFFGEHEFKGDAAFDAPALQDLIGQARAGLRQAAWGDQDAWNEKKTYRYDGPPSFRRCKDDLIMLAKKGYAFYDAIIDRVSGGVAQSRQLTAMMRTSGEVQIALKESARHVLPAALIYDHPLDNGRNDADYQICPAFEAACKAGVPLATTACFQGTCPAYGEPTTVCPSGFWGYRHLIGMPVSLSSAPDAPTEIAWRTPPSLTMAVSTELAGTPTHRKALDSLKSNVQWNYADTRDAAIALFKKSKPHVVYFYCHGGLADNQPYLRVGPKSGPRITRSIFRTYAIQWDQPRPLVFINGCHTTALEPEQAIELVSGFIGVAQAAGVIGTEITVFESLASAFAEPFLASFVADAKSAGEAMRAARLALLQAGNPLGLAYVPFVMTSLRMVEA